VADTPRRKRKTKAPIQIPPPIVLPAETDLPTYASLVVNADEVHLLISSLAAAIVVAVSDDDDDPDVQKRIEEAMFFLDNTDPAITESLVVKLERAHTVTCPTAHDHITGS
jgi:hypothetical protein